MSNAAAESLTSSKIAEQFRPYVHKVVSSLITTLGLPLDLKEEFYSAGYLGLVEAASRFDPKSGKDFRAFAFLRVRGAVIDYIRESNELSGSAYREAKALRAADESWHTLAPESTSLSNIVEYAVQTSFIFRLSYKELEDELVLPANDVQNPDTFYERKQLYHSLKKLVSRLPEKERIVIEEYYFRDKSFAHIASTHSDLSKSWISRLHRRALKRLSEWYLEDADE